jgi:type I restriction enzyme R subunit
MPSNFAFLQTHFPDLHRHATQVENLVYSSPRASCFYARYALEQTVKWLYANDPYLQPPDDPSKLSNLIHEPSFKDNLSPGLFPKIRLIQRIGNRAVHEDITIGTRDALQLTEDLFHLLYWVARYYSPQGTGRSLGQLTFDRNAIPRPTTAEPAPSRQQLQALAEQLAQAEALKRLAEERARQTEAELAQAKADRDALIAQNQPQTDRHDYNEADTRRYLIDLRLQEAGWDPQQPGATEVEVEGMPNDSGKGYVDYVLWGDDGKPLALVEAKRTTASPNTGKHQAVLYADCLEQRYQQRPVIFYTNGYETWLWDDRRYAPRPISGFLKKEELERLIFRRSQRKRLHLLPINDAIVDRSYQQEAIRRIAERFDQQNYRKALLVMATGTGKTRTAIALIDLLMRANWVNRALFLADRNALVTQAFRAFQKNLPQVTTIDLTKHKADLAGAKVVLSTYPTMLNAINRGLEQSPIPFFGPGTFDLVLVDEAHRSIYQKYGTLFDYFDSLLVGLTATPRDEVDRDTYRIFDLEQGVPTFAYELNDAVNDGYLVPPRGISAGFKFMRSGVRYDDLTPEEQAEYEIKFRDEDTDDLPRQIDANALNRWLFNASTVDQALELLMQFGLKVDGGDRLGKTIIFARKHEHAEFILERFNRNYPHYKGQFAQIIDNYATYAQSLLEQFSDPKQQPTIAISVDMLDTGVDVPEVVNLVFFKPVFSRVKFNQMIGRATRLCLDLFGPGAHKTHFLVFDLCGNLDYFRQELEEANQAPRPSLTTRLVQHRLELVTLLNQPESDLHQSLLDSLHQHVATMAPENFLVRRHLRQVETFADRERWNTLSDEDRIAIATHLAPLPNGLPTENPLCKRFDLLCVKVQIALLRNDPAFTRLRDQIRDTAAQLLSDEKRNLPMVKLHLPLIEALQAEGWWTDVTPAMVEEVRRHLRQLVPFVDRDQQQPVYTDFADEMHLLQEADVPTYSTGFSRYQYEKQVKAFIRSQENHVAIAKLKRNLPLTDTDLTALEDMLFQAEAVESRDRFEEVFGTDKSLKRFIREIVGLDRSAAKAAFSRYLEGETLGANQIRFIEQIIDLLTQQGIMDPGQLYEEPFTGFHEEGVEGLFADDDVDDLIAIVQAFNTTVGVDFSGDPASA